MTRYLHVHVGMASAFCTLLRELGRHPHATELATIELHHHDLVETQTDGDLTPNKMADLSYMSRVISEVLRLTPPVGGGLRTALRTVQVGVS